MVQPLHASEVSRSVWIAGSAVATEVWSIDTISRAIATTPKTRNRPGRGWSAAGRSDVAAVLPGSTVTIRPPYLLADRHTSSGIFPAVAGRTGRVRPRSPAAAGRATRD